MYRYHIRTVPFNPLRTKEIQTESLSNTKQYVDLLVYTITLKRETK